MKRLLLPLMLLLGAVAPLQAADYVIDTEGNHAFIQFKIQHLGYSWLSGRFNDFDGRFSYDTDKPAETKVTVNIDPASIDTNHAERDKHLRSKDFLHVDKFPKAKFVSTGYAPGKDGKGVLQGELTLHGVTQPITIEVEEVGHGPDPWGGYRHGFYGTTTLTLQDFGIDYNLGPKAREVYMELSIEGVRQ